MWRSFQHESRSFLHESRSFLHESLANSTYSTAVLPSINPLNPRRNRPTEFAIATDMLGGSG